jgi:Na+/H+ antiporter NhaD/arsenite permease-like protein
MATPVGNPQNLFLYANYELSAGQFFGLLLPPTLVSLVLLVVASLLVKGETIHVTFLEKTQLRETKKLLVYGVLFGLCLLSVFDILHYGILTVIVAAVFLLLDRSLLKEVDYSLLLTFICFFIFSGNLGQLTAVQELLGGMLQKNALLTSVAASQVISNVPAAILLSSFTDNWKELLLGVDVGGLGTPIASLASLISLKLYMKAEGAQPAKYMVVFTVVNLIGLAILIPLSMILTA